MGAANKKIGISSDLAARYAAKAVAGASNKLTPEQARNIYLATTVLVQFARDAEHAAFMVMSEILGNGNAVSTQEFSEFTTNHLRGVKDQLVFIGQIINAKAG